MPSSRLDSHRISVQNGMVERFTAFMATIFVPNFDFYAAATFCPLDENGKKEQKTKKLRKVGQDIPRAFLGVNLIWKHAYARIGAAVGTSGLYFITLAWPATVGHDRSWLAMLGPSMRPPPPYEN